nr:MAG TPA: hypothetical protein [Caudoviricetes sp.]
MRLKSRPTAAPRPPCRKPRRPLRIRKKPSLRWPQRRQSWASLMAWFPRDRRLRCPPCSNISRA